MLRGGGGDGGFDNGFCFWWPEVVTCDFGWKFYLMPLQHVTSWGWCPLGEGCRGEWWDAIPTLSGLLSPIPAPLANEHRRGIGGLKSGHEKRAREACTS